MRARCLALALSVIATGVVAAQDVGDAWSGVASRGRATALVDGRLAFSGETSGGTAVLLLDVREPGGHRIELRSASALQIALFTSGGYLLAASGGSGNPDAAEAYLPQVGRYVAIVAREVKVDERRRFESIVPAGGRMRFDIDIRKAPVRLALEPVSGDGATVQAAPGELPDYDERAAGFQEVIAAAQPLRGDGDRLVGEGSVAAGFEVFQLSPPAPRVAIEVVVTATYPGLGYDDSDSMLFLFDGDGRQVKWDDDGGDGTASRIDAVSLHAGEAYYIVVTTFPARPELDGAERFRELTERGQSYIDFRLVVEPR